MGSVLTLNTNAQRILLFDICCTLLVFLRINCSLFVGVCPALVAHENNYGAWINNQWISMDRKIRRFTKFEICQKGFLRISPDIITSNCSSFNCTDRPCESCKYLRAGPAEMPFQNWYTANTNHFPLTDSVKIKSKRQLG